MKRVIATAMLIGALAGNAIAEEPRVITTMGTGVVEAAPDMATISLGVVNEARLAGDALDATSRAVRTVLDRLADAGIADRDVQTSNLSLQPVWSRHGADNSAPRITGFMARNNLSVRVRELSELGGILDLVVQDGANTFDGLQFSLQEPEAAMADARAEAVKDAMARARQLASAAGVTLGPVQSISESGGYIQPQMMAMNEARMAADVPVAAGEISLSAQVSMVFAIVD